MPNPVMKDGKLENFTISILRANVQETFKCQCGCNVFHKPDDTKPNVYECNSCGIRYEGE